MNHKILQIMPTYIRVLFFLILYFLQVTYSSNAYPLIIICVG